MKEFEDMSWQEWPEELIELHAATQEAWSAYAALEEILDNRVRLVLNQDTTRSAITELAGRAYALLRDLRAEGMRQLAAWEESQKTEEEDYQRKRIENWNAVADGLQPPHPSEY